ncbi:MAG: DUF1552 domain-containing protein [Planctomycetes bacterium]|nr:DUF1552 domain-containing protein [Planctomycetota bacterium]
MRPFRRRCLDRRTFLRGSACAVALPWLDAMQPALTATVSAPRRAVFVFAPNGMDMARWRPNGEGAAMRLSETLAPLGPLRDRLTVFSGLAIDGGRAHGDGFGDHARAGGSFLTCAHPRKTAGADILAGTSVDQLIAEQVGGETRLPSLELGMEPGRSAGSCDSGYSCAYSSYISWRTSDKPVAKEVDPRAVFARLFGDPALAQSAEQAERQRRRDRSVLDAVRADAKSLSGRLGAADRGKLADYLESVRELETRLARLDAERSEVALPAGLMTDGASFAERLGLIYEIMALAIASESTRVISLMLGNAGSNLSYRFLGVPEGHHDLSHHGKDAAKCERIARINRFHVEMLGAFLQRLAAEREGDGDLLSRTLVVFGSALSDGNRHNHDDLPMLLAGEGGGVAKGRGHVAFAKETPLANLYLAVLRGMGRADDSFADSTAALDLG